MKCLEFTVTLVLDVGDNNLQEGLVREAVHQGVGDISQTLGGMVGTVRPRGFCILRSDEGAYTWVVEPKA